MANVSFRPFLTSDLLALDVQPRHKAVLERTLASVFSLYTVGQSVNSFTMLENGKVKACCGEINGSLWAFLGNDLKRCMLPLTRYGLARLNDLKPVKAWIDKDNPNAVRWAKVAGFRPSSHGYWYFD